MAEKNMFWEHWSMFREHFCTIWAYFSLFQVKTAVKKQIYAVLTATFFVIFKKVVVKKGLFYVLDSHFSCIRRHIWETWAYKGMFYAKSSCKKGVFVPFGSHPAKNGRKFGCQKCIFRSFDRQNIEE